MSFGSSYPEFIEVEEIGMSPMAKKNCRVFSFKF